MSKPNITHEELVELAIKEATERVAECDGAASWKDIAYDLANDLVSQDANWAVSHNKLKDEIDGLTLALRTANATIKAKDERLMAMWTGKEVGDA